MPSSAGRALALAAIALLVPALAGCGSATVPASSASDLVGRIKENAGPAERSYMDEHRKALEDATGIELPAEDDEPGGAEVEYGEDGGPAGGGEEQTPEFDENGEVGEARS